MYDQVFARARSFVYRNARPLDMARFRYHFEGGSRESVLRALETYQNEDGGFGHALEADMWNPNSSPIQTWVAQAILSEVGLTDANHKIVDGILRYLGSGKDFDGQFWTKTSPGNADHPHAPWWNEESAHVKGKDYNPTAALAGFIVRFADRESDLFQLGLRIAQEATQAYLKGDMLEDMHQVTCFAELLSYAEDADIPGAIDVGELKARLRQQVKQSITHDRKKWETGYVCKPSRFMRSRESVFYPGNEDIADYQCDFIARTQLPDGSWSIPWNWAGYPEQWAISKNWWKGRGVVLNLLYLKGMGRLRDDLRHKNLPKTPTSVRFVCDPEERKSIAREILLALPDWFGIPEVTEKYIADATDLPFWAAFREYGPVGFATLKPTGPTTAEIHVMGIRPECHREGVGRLLFSSLYDFCRREGYEFLQVKTVDAGHYEDYDRTRLFYESMGFRKFESLPTFWDKRNPCLVMVMAVR